MNTHAAPTSRSTGAPTSAVLPSEDSATLLPKKGMPTTPAPVSFSPCWVQVEPERVNTHAAPRSPLSPHPPIRAVLPSEDSATLEPKSASPIAPPGMSFPPCCVQVEPERVNTHAAPTPLSPGPPISAVLPSEDSATLSPKRAPPISPPPVSFLPCWTSGSIRSG